MRLDDSPVGKELPRFGISIPPGFRLNGTINILAHIDDCQLADFALKDMQQQKLQNRGIDESF